MTREEYLLMLKGEWIEKIKETYLIAVNKYGWTLKYVPVLLRDKEICLTAVKNFGDALKYVPEGMLPESKIIKCMWKTLYINKIDREW